MHEIQMKQMHLQKEFNKTYKKHFDIIRFGRKEKLSWYIIIYKMILALQLAMFNLRVKHC